MGYTASSGRAPNLLRAKQHRHRDKLSFFESTFEGELRVPIA